jgi:hypothetical protein
MNDDLRAARTLTQKDLDDAPVGTVVRAADGTIAARYDRQRGVVFGDDRPFPWKVLQAPAVTLWPRDDRQDRSAAHAARGVVYAWVDAQPDPPDIDETKLMLGRLTSQLGQPNAITALEVVISLGWRPVDLDEDEGSE